MAIFSFALLAACWWSDYPEFATLGFAGLAALTFACSLVILRPRLSVTRDIRPPRTAVGEFVRTEITIENLGHRRTLPTTLVESFQGERRPHGVPSLAAGQSHLVAGTLPASRRGIYHAELMRLGRCDPLGLVWVGTTHSHPATFSVHPRIHRVVPTLLGRSPDVDGPASGGVGPPGAAFYGIREYQRGDDWRLIHWPSTARRGALTVRHEVAPTDPYMSVVLDTSAKSYTEQSFEEAVSAAASLCVAGVQAGLPLELRSTAGLRFSMPASRAEPAAIDRLLDIFAEIRLALQGNLAALPSLLPAESGASLTVVTGQPPLEQLTMLVALRGRFSIVSLVRFTKSSSKVPVDGVNGLVALTAGTSEEFAAGWNELARR